MAEGGEWIDMEDFDPREEDVDEESSFTEPILDTSVEEREKIDRYTSKLTEETSEENINRLRTEIKKTKVDAFYNVIKEKYKLEPLFRDYSKFELDKNGDVFVNGKKITKGDSSQYLALSTLTNKYGITFVREQLGLSDYKPLLSSKTKQILNDVDQIVVEEIPMQELPNVAKRVDSNIQKLYHELGTNTDELPFRELMGLDQTLQRTRGELINNLGKLGKIDEHYVEQKKRLDAAERSGNEALQKEIRKSIKDLVEERKIRLEVASQNDAALRSQINRIKETLDNLTDTTLVEKIRILFREQGITVVSILSALALAISTIVASIIASVRGPPTPSPAPTPSPGQKNVKEWIKSTLKHLSNVLKTLGGKALDALPGIIGTAISWIFNAASNAVSWLADHVYAFISGIVVLIVMYLQNELK